MKRWVAVPVLCIAAAHSSLAWPHGESVRGAGGATLNTVGAEIAEGSSVSIRYDRRAYRQFSDQQLLDFRRVQGEDVHQHAKEESVFLSYTVGFSEDWDLSFLLPYNRFSNFKDNGDASAAANNTLSVTDVSKGLGDLLILGRRRVWQAGDHTVAGLFGLKLPTGDIRQKTNAGEIVGTHNQPGSGSVDFQLGAAYTGHFLEERFGISADVLSRVNTQGAGNFRSGNSLQADVAFSHKPHSSLVPIAELNFLTQQRDIENNQIKTNSGVSSLFLSLGARMSVSRDGSAFVSVGLPLWQRLPGIQTKEKTRFGVGYGLSF